MEGINAAAEQQTASMEEITATATKLGMMAEDLKDSLTKDMDPVKIKGKKKESKSRTKKIEKGSILNGFRKFKKS